MPSDFWICQENGTLAESSIPCVFFRFGAPKSVGVFAQKKELGIARKCKNLSTKKLVGAPALYRNQKRAKYPRLNPNRKVGIFSKSHLLIKLYQTLNKL